MLSDVKDRVGVCRVAISSMIIGCVCVYVCAFTDSFKLIWFAAAVFLKLDQENLCVCVLAVETCYCVSLMSYRCSFRKIM